MTGCSSSDAPPVVSESTTTTTLVPNEHLPRVTDDFAIDGQPNTSTWAVYEGAGTNGRGQARKENVAVRDGVLNLTGRGSDIAGLCWCGPATHDYAFGDYRFRVRVDAGVGFAAVVGLWPDSEKWPEDGEIDLLETPDGNRQSVLSTLHYGADNQQFGKRITRDFTRWQNITLKWRPDSLTVLYGTDVVLFTTDRAQIPQTPMHVFFQLDVGDGSYIPFADATTPAEVNFQIQRVTFTPIVGVSQILGSAVPIRAIY